MTIRELLAHPIAADLAEAGIPFTITAGGTLELDGFSKSGTAQLSLKSGQLHLDTRYNTQDIVQSVDDIVDVAFRWWESYRERAPFEVPSEIWLPHFKRLSLITVTETIRTSYSPTGA